MLYMKYYSVVLFKSNVLVFVLWWNIKSKLKGVDEKHIFLDKLCVYKG